MRTLTLCLILVLYQACTTRACKSDYPVAYMCQTGVVRGPGVTLDVSTAAATDFSSCSCSVKSNVTGFMVEFIDNPNVTDCGVQLDILFDDFSMQMKCGVPVGGQLTNGKTAKIQYTKDTDVDKIDSKYCLSFYANRSDVELTLSCVVRDQTSIPTTSLVQSTLMTTLSPLSSVKTSPYNTTPAFSSSDPASQTSFSTTVMHISTSLPPTDTSTVLRSLNSTVTQTTSNTSTTSTMTSMSTVKAESVSNVSTQSSYETTTSINTTTFSSLATENNKTTDIVVGTTARNATDTTTIFPDNVTTATIQPNVNTTFTTKIDHGNTTTSVNDNDTLAQETSTISTARVLMSTENSSSENITEVTTIQNNMTTTIDAAIEANTTYNTTIHNTSPSFLNTTQTTSAFMNVTTEQPKVHNTTISHDNTTAVNITKATKEYSVTTNMYENYTTASNTTISTTYNTTVEPSTNTTTFTIERTDANTNNTTRSNDTQTTAETNSTTTDVYSNTTEVTMASGSENTTSIPQEITQRTNFTTTGLYNETTDNSTAETNVTTNDNTTAKSEKTTQGFWEPPIQNYDVPSRSNNVVVILVPVAGILLVVFIAVVVYIMCKRAKEASRRTMAPTIKTKANKNIEPNKNTSDTEKPENPGDMFVTKSNGKYPAKYKTENEKTETNKTNLMGSIYDEQLLKEQFNATLNGSTMASTTKPSLYEPTKKEKDILDHLELSAIVIENDPDDSNRYFKKSDPGDWYRVIMKGKKPRDSEEILGKTVAKNWQQRKEKSKSSGSENETGETKKRRKKHNDRKHRPHSEIGLNVSIKGKSKARHSSSDSFNKSLEEDYMKASKNANQTRYSLNKPSIEKVSSHGESHDIYQPRQVISKSINEVGQKPEPVKTRMIVSKPNSVSIPTPISNNNSKDSVIHTNSKPSGQSREDSDSFTSSTSTGSETSTAPMRNTPLRSSQTRNSLFASGSNRNVQNSNEKADTQLAVKRPEIVPPLNLTETGDKVGRLEDGFEEFLLSEC